MNLLVGIPVFRLAPLVRRCLASLVDSPATVLAVDNAADADVKAVLREFEDVYVLQNHENGYCNGGWNRAMAFGLANGFDVIGLGSSDAMLHAGWYSALSKWVADGRDEVWLPSIGSADPIAPHTAEVATNVAGYFNFLPRRAIELVYPIPIGLKHWFGDQYMFEKLRRHGWKTMVVNDIRGEHPQGSVTRATPESYARIEADKREWALLTAAAQ